MTMNRAALALLLLSLLAVPGLAQRKLIMDPHLYDAEADAKAEIRRAIARASREHKRVLLVFGGNWCLDCHVLNTAFHQPEIQPLLDANFLVVHVDIGKYDKNLDIAKRYQVPLQKGVPAVAVVETNGSLLYSQQAGEFESARKLTLEDFAAFLQKWKPKA